MAYKFQIGTAQLSGNLIQEGTVSASNGQITGKALTIDPGQSVGVVGDTNLMTLNANSVDVEGDVSASLGFEGLDLLIQSGKTIGINGDADLMTLDPNQVSVAGTLSSSVAIESLDLDLDGTADIEGGLSVGAANAFAVNGSGQISSCPSGSITDLFVGDDAHVVGDLTVEGSTNIAGLVATTMSGTAVTFTTIGGTSLALQSGGITAAGAIAGVTTITGSSNAQFGGTLDVAHGKFSINATGEIDVCPSASFGDVFIDDELEVKDNVTVHGFITASDALLVGAGASIGRGGLTINTTGEITACPSGSITDLLVGDDAHVVGDLLVEGSTRFAKVLHAASASFTNIFTSGSVQFRGKIRAENGIEMDNIIMTDAGAISGVTTITGSSNAQFGGTLDVAHGKFSIDASGQIDVCPSASIADLLVSDALQVVGTSVLNGQTHVQAGNFIVGAGGEFQVDVSNGNVDTNGTLTAAGTVSGSIFNFDATSKAEFSRDVLPFKDNDLALGSSSRRWKEIYVENVIGAVINVETETFTSNNTIAAATGFAIANSSTPFQLDLPAGSDGKIVRIKNIGTGDVTLSASNGAERISDETNGDLVVLESEGAAVTCVYVGTAGSGLWHII